MISVELSGRFKKIVREARREAEVAATLKLVVEGFGNPHAHTGLAIRKLLALSQTFSYSCLIFWV